MDFEVFDLKAGFTPFMIGTGGNVLIGSSNLPQSLGYAGGEMVVAHNAGTSSPQVEVSPMGYGGSNASQVSKVRFDATFDQFPSDQGPRAAAQLVGGYNGGPWGNEYLAFQVGGSNDGHVDPVEHMRITAAGNVGIGTTAPSYPLSVNGTIQAKEVLVQTGWSDYVFAPTYHLEPLKEVEKDISAQHHLPGVPSAQDVAAHGISMGHMEAELLAKVEELTLHAIAQEKRIDELASRNAKLEAEVSALEAQR